MSEDEAKPLKEAHNIREATAGADRRYAGAKILNDGTVELVVTHSRGGTLDYDRVAVLPDGRVVGNDSTSSTRMTQSGLGMIDVVRSSFGETLDPKIADEIRKVAKAALDGGLFTPNDPKITDREANQLESQINAIQAKMPMKNEGRF